MGVLDGLRAISVVERAVCEGLRILVVALVVSGLANSAAEVFCVVLGLVVDAARVI